MSGDPVVEAAQRAWDDDQLSTWPSQNAVAGAREALKPVRLLHRVWDAAPGRRCFECDTTWPCETAKLVYTSEELSK